MQRLASDACGQALTEFLVIATFLLIPLMLIIPVVAGLLSQRQDVEVAARYAVWERTVWHQNAPSGPGGAGTVKTDEQVAGEIDARILSRDTQALSSDMTLQYELDPFALRTPQGDALLVDSSQGAANVARYAVQSASETEPEGLVGVANQTIGAIGRFTRFDLNRRGLFEASVSVDIVDLTGLFDLAGLRFDQLRISRSSTLFAEAWTGGSKAHTEHQISGLLPQQFLDNGAVRAAQNFAGHQPFGEELGSRYLDFGHTDIDPMPAYRLGPVAPPQ